jgi:hypothetical protein
MAALAEAHEEDEAPDGEEQARELLDVKPK